jgi:hypothetical protein
METVNQSSSVESAFYSIKWAHQMAGVSDPCISEMIKNIVEACKRKLCRPIEKKNPITPEVMIQLFKSLNTENRTLKEQSVFAFNNENIHVIFIKCNIVCFNITQFILP